MSDFRHVVLATEDADRLLSYATKQRDLWAKFQDAWLFWDSIIRALVNGTDA